MLVKYDGTNFVLKRNFHNRHYPKVFIHFHRKTPGTIMRDATVTPFVTESDLKPGYYWPELIY